MTGKQSALSGLKETPGELVARAKAGDSAAFAELVREHTPAVFRLLSRQLGPTEAEDATQEVFLRVHRGLGKFRGDARFDTWIYRIATNVGLQRLRTKRRRPFLERFGLGSEPASPLPAPDHTASVEEKRDALRRALELLPDGQRAVVVMRMEGIPFEAIAKSLGIRRPTAESRMARAKDRLRVLLADWHDGATS